MGFVRGQPKFRLSVWRIDNPLFMGGSHTMPICARSRACRAVDFSLATFPVNL